MSDVEPRVRDLEKNMATVISSLDTVAANQRGTDSKLDKIIEMNGQTGRTDWRLVLGCVGVVLTIWSMTVAWITTNINYRVAPTEVSLQEVKEENEKQWRYITRTDKKVYEIQRNDAYADGRAGRKLK